MHCATDSRLLRPSRAGLPLWCDAFLAPPGSGDVFATRAWYDSIIGHACPPSAEPMLALCGDAMLVPLFAEASRLRSMVTPYSLEWRPLAARGATPTQAAGRALAALLRGGPPTRLEAMAGAIAPWLEGLREGGMVLGAFRHFGNWRGLVADWPAYLQSRPPALRNTIQRKLARAAHDVVFSRVAAPGPVLDHAIDDFIAVRDRSWKPAEPFPLFDAVLLRAMAAQGAARLGVLRGADGQAIAAQYWLVDGGRAHLMKLVHDRAAVAASPGTVLTALMIRDLIEQDGVRELDFGRGDDPYKQLWVAERRQRMGMMVTDPWHPAGMLELARQAAGHGRRWLRGASA